MDLSAVVLPGAGFDLLVGLTWIVKAGVVLDPKHRVLVYYEQDHIFKIMSVPEPPKGVVTTFIYAQEHCGVLPMGSAPLKLAHF